MIAFIRLSSDDEEILKHLSNRLVRFVPSLPGYTKVRLYPILYRQDKDEDLTLF